MKAALVKAYGDPAAIEVAEVPTPTPKAGEVQIKIYATTVQTGDWRIQSLDVPAGMALPLKLIFGFGKPKSPIFGTELSGEISAVGAGVTRFTVGDQVVAITGMKLGGHAEYIVLPETAAIAPKPANLSHVAAASLPFGFTTAWHFLHEMAKLKEGESLLVNGASGATGTAAVQVGSLLGAQVTAVCRAENFPLVKGLGAKACYDYRSDDLLASDRRFDVICDSVGRLTPAATAALKPGGRLILLSAGLGDMLLAPLRNALTDRKIIGGMADDGPEILSKVLDLAAKEQVVPVIDAVYPLADIAKAFAHVASRHKKGNVVVQVATAPGEERAASQ